MKTMRVGGQAVIEGVMMKAGSNIAVAVRTPSGEIKVKKEKLRWKESKIPFLRGVVNLFIMLYTGMKTLSFSADVASGGEGEVKSSSLIISGVLALVFGLILFKFLPLGAASLIDNKFGLSSVWFNVVDGFIRFGIILIYIVLISQMKDVRRVFQYHGAEHKTVNCFEAGKELTVKNVQSFSTVHKRCGTTFVFLVVLISLFVFMLIPKSLGFTWLLGLRILLLPVIASISYEVLMLGAKVELLKPLILPGLLVQKLTTQEPDDKQVEVAIASLKAALQ